MKKNLIFSFYLIFISFLVFADETITGDLIMQPDNYLKFVTETPSANFYRGGLSVSGYRVWTFDDGENPLLSIYGEDRLNDIDKKKGDIKIHSGNMQLLNGSLYMKPTKKIWFVNDGLPFDHNSKYRGSISIDGYRKFRLENGHGTIFTVCGEDNIGNNEKTGDVFLNQGSLYIKDSNKVKFTSDGTPGGFYRGGIRVDYNRIWRFESPGGTLMTIFGEKSDAYKKNIGDTVLNLGNLELKKNLTVDGNVGIGCNNPTEKLTVNGTIKARRVIVQDIVCTNDIQTNLIAADFVFQPDYNLKPLSEVETYIRANGHLPDVPSAESIRKDGIGLAEMNTLLLQKVEELTLHLIEVKKENAALKNELDTRISVIEKSIAKMK